MICDSEREAWEAFENDPGPPGAKGAGIRTAERIRGAGVEAVITGRLGPHPLEKLRGAGIRVCRANGITAAAAVEEFGRGTLADYAASPEDRCRHDVRDAD
jgi:predicted Fe-Mo cluster-binding NifX family protein